MYVAGFVSGDIARTPDGGLPGQTSLGSVDAFVRKYDATGAEQWTRQFGWPGDDHGYSLSVDSAGNVYFVGDFAASPATQSEPEPIASFLRKYDPGGPELSARTDIYAQSVAVGSDDAVYVAA